MAVIVVGGQSRKVGKSAVVAGLIRAIPERHWTAIKISGHTHNATEGKLLISRETSGSGHADTARFLQAGAELVYWARGGGDSLALAVPHIREIIAQSANTIIESNSIMRFLDPDLYLLVLDFGVEDFKSSAREFLPRASAFIVSGGGRRLASQADIAALAGMEAASPKDATAASAGAQAAALPQRPVFPICPPEYVSPELLAFVRERLAGLITKNQERITKN